jgi:hypothetical protein
VIEVSQELRNPVPSTTPFPFETVKIAFVRCIKGEILKPLMLQHGLEGFIPVVLTAEQYLQEGKFQSVEQVRQHLEDAAKVNNLIFYL